MSSPMREINGGVAKIIAILSVLLVLLTITLVWLVVSRFFSENKLSDARAKANILIEKNSMIASSLSECEAEIVRMRASFPDKNITMSNLSLRESPETGELMERIRKADADVKQAREVAKVARNELAHAIEQSGQIEKRLKSRIVLLEKERDEALKSFQRSDAVGNETTVALKDELRGALRQLESANSELLALRRLQNQEKASYPKNLDKPQPVSTKPLSSSRQVSRGNESIIGQIKAIETANQFVVIQLNTSKSVQVGDGLAVTRQGSTIGILSVYRMGPQGIVFAVLTPDLRDKIRVGDIVFMKK